MIVADFDRKVHAYIHALSDRSESMYAARYAHSLVARPERALELAEASKYGIRASRRAKIRKDILSFVVDGRL